jgi:hypothetical protein
MSKDVDYLPMAKPDSNYSLGDPPRLCVSFRRCRSLVVLTEGPDLCPLDMEMVSETCEIEVQGCLEADRLCS